MKHRTKLSQKQEHVAEQQTQPGTAGEFSNSDELLRYDAAQTPVPPEVARRLKKSAAEILPKKSRSWWKDLFAG